MDQEKYSKDASTHESEEETDKEYILSTKDNKYSNYYTVLSEHQKNKILGETDKKLRFCIVTGLKRKENMQKVQRNVWIPGKEIYPEDFGLQQESPDNEDQKEAIKLIRGKGVVKENMALVRMVANAFNTPCPTDVIEKIIEGNAERSNSVPIHTMGQIIETMGMQTQVGAINTKLLRKIEVPCLLEYGSNVLNK